MEAVGSDSDGREFKNANEMWKEEIGEEGEADKKQEWYRKGVGYWEVSNSITPLLSLSLSLGCCFETLLKSVFRIGFMISFLLKTFFGCRTWKLQWMGFWGVTGL